MCALWSMCGVMCVLVCIVFMCMCAMRGVGCVGCANRVVYGLLLFYVEFLLMSHVYMIVGSYLYGLLPVWLSCSASECMCVYVRIVCVHCVCSVVGMYA